MSENKDPIIELRSQLEHILRGFAQETKMPYHSVIGALEMIKLDLYHECLAKCKAVQVLGTRSKEVKDEENNKNNKDTTAGDN